MTRLEKHAQAKALRDSGLLLREIAEQMGVSVSMVNDLLTDPTGEKARERKRRYERPCVDCGATVNPNGVRPGEARCRKCTAEHERRVSRRWVIESVREWADLHGGIPPVATDWNLSHAHATGQGWRVARYEATGRLWPSVPCAQRNFGSWRAAIEAAGFESFQAGCYGREGEGLCTARLDEIKERYAAGESATEIAETLGSDSTTVLYWLRREGVKIRSRSEAQRLRWARLKEAA